MGVLDILKTSGSLAVNELNVRKSGSPDALLRELTVLHDGGLVDFDGHLPEASAIPEANVEIRLTRAGLRKSMR